MRQKASLNSPANRNGGFKPKNDRMCKTVWSSFPSTSNRVAPCCAQLLPCCSNSCDNVFELWLQRCATHKKTINVWLCRQIWGIRSITGATILDADVLGDF